MAGLVDTNILLYAANQDSPEHEAAREFLQGALGGAEQWYLSEGIVYEFLRVSTHAKVFSQPLLWNEALSFLNPLLESPAFAVLAAGADHWVTLAQVLEPLTHPAGNLFFDIRTVVLMQEHGIRQIFTADTDFLQFEEIEAINPLR